MINSFQPLKKLELTIKSQLMCLPKLKKYDKIKTSVSKHFKAFSR